MRPDAGLEWLETDGLGGFASGTASGLRTRRYHALLLAAKTPPTERFVLVNGFEAWIETAAGTFALSSQRYSGDVTHPDGARRIASFEVEPWPRWRFRLEGGAEIEQAVFVSKGAPLTSVSWRLSSPSPKAILHVRPLMSGRDYHSLQRENPAFNFRPEIADGALRWNPYPGVPHVLMWANGEYRHEPVWYRNFLYEEERRRGLDCVEDLASPGVFRWDLSQGEAVWMMAAGGVPASLAFPRQPLDKHLETLRSLEAHRRGRFGSPLDLAADAYLVRRDHGSTLIAGYPWFTDWGRDTFIALRGLCLATGRQKAALDILLAWSGAVSEGMLPNRFPDQGTSAEFNSVDASLWFIIAVHDLLVSLRKAGQAIPPGQRDQLLKAAQAILAGYRRGTRFGIHMDGDGLLACGEPGTQLTWMDARIDGSPVTPRIGKPVEVEALWINALGFASSFNEAWREPFERALGSFQRRFWNEEKGCLFDVIDADHQPGQVDAAMRPNQIFAVGGLPLVLLSDERAQRVLAAVERRLLTPLGLRSLAPGEAGYSPRYEGGVAQRDGAYHQGVAWPWLLGPFVEAWVRVRSDTPQARQEARERFLDPLLARRGASGLGHLPEIADSEPPYSPRGCPFQAWSLGEALRLDRIVLALPSPAAAQRGHDGRTSRGRQAERIKSLGRGLR